MPGLSQLDPSGHAIFITGVPSSGKSTLSRALVERSPSFLYLSGDATIRELHPGGVPHALALLEGLLARVEALMAKRNVVVDMSMPYTYTQKARTGSETRALCRTSRQRTHPVARDETRSDRGPVSWNPDLTRLLGPRSFYDLTIDTGKLTPTEAVELVLEAALQRWHPARD